MTTAQKRNATPITMAYDVPILDLTKHKKKTEVDINHKRARAPLMAIIAPSIAFFGCQFSWAVQDGNVSPYLRELGMNTDTMNYAWLLGPISGIIFEPIIGVFSDHCTSSFGRRRPFIIFGSLLLSLCLLIFCFSEYFFSPLLVAFITFWQLDFSTNMLEGPLRAITSDTLNHEEQLLSHSWFGIMNGVASTIGFGLGYFVGEIRIIFCIAAFVMLICVILTSVLVNEVPLKKIKLKPKTNDESMRKVLMVRLKQLLIALMDMPYIVKRCWFIQFCTYFGHFAMWVYLCEYFGTQIMNGDPNKHSQKHVHLLYKHGVEYGNLAFMFISIVSVIFSFCTTTLVKMVGLKKLWMICLFLYALVLMSSIFIYNLYIALFIFSFVGIPWGVSFTIPWGVIGIYSNKYDSKRACLWTVLLNIAECGPELIIALFSGFIVELFKGKVAGVLVIAGVVNLFAVYLISSTDLTEYNGLHHHKDNTESNNNKHLDESQALLSNDDEKMVDKLQEIITHNS